MAIAHIRRNIVSRSLGQSVVAKAAYNSCSSLAAEDGAKDYRRKRGLAYAQIITADGSAAPDRGAYWRAVEAGERRKDAQLAYSYAGALPRELNRDQHIRLAEDYTRQIIERYGIAAADLCIHYPTRRKPGSSGQDNPHIHLLMPTRTASGHKLRLYGDQADIMAVRQLWEDTVNKHLEAAGLETRISVARLEDQIAANKANIIRYDDEIRQLQADNDGLRRYADGPNQAAVATATLAGDRAPDGREVRCALGDHRRPVRRDIAEHRGPIARDSQRPGQPDGRRAPRDGRGAPGADQVGTGAGRPVDALRVRVEAIRGQIRAYARKIDLEGIQAAREGQEVQQICQQTYRPA